jgi:hypothetical protein
MSITIATRLIIPTINTMINDDLSVGELGWYFTLVSLGNSRSPLEFLCPRLGYYSVSKSIEGGAITGFMLELIPLLLFSMPNTLYGCMHDIRMNFGS